MPYKVLLLESMSVHIKKNELNEYFFFTNVTAVYKFYWRQAD